MTLKYKYDSYIFNGLIDSRGKQRKAIIMSLSGELLLALAGVASIVLIILFALKSVIDDARYVPLFYVIIFVIRIAQNSHVYAYFLEAIGRYFSEIYLVLSLEVEINARRLRGMLFPAANSQSQTTPPYAVAKLKWHTLASLIIQIKYDLLLTYDREE